MAISRGTGILSVSVDAKKLLTMIGGYVRTIPKAMDKGLKNLAGVYALKYLEQMPRAKSTSRTNQRGIESWTGRSFNILRNQIQNPIKIGTGYGVVVPGTLIALDQMRRHPVPLRRGKSITAWANRKLPSHGRSITVYPHPWIENANRNARRFIKTHPRKEIEKALARQGR